MHRERVYLCTLSLLPVLPPSSFPSLSLFFLPPQRCCPWLPARRGSHSNRPLLVDQWRGSLHSNRFSESQLEEEGGRKKKRKRKGKKGIQLLAIPARASENLKSVTGKSCLGCLEDITTLALHALHLCRGGGALRTR